MSNESIAEAITRITTHIRRFSHLMVHDTDRLPPEKEFADHKAKVESLCDELDALAKRSESEDVRFPDFDAIRSKLYFINAVAPVGDLEAVQYAFIAAKRI